jgi:dTMP kinase
VADAFITFEGIDGSGKSTQLRMLAEHLQARNVDLIVTREPGGTPLGLRLRNALLQAEEHVDPLAELLLYAADRAQHVRSVIRPGLKEEKVVISDRFADATRAYQGAGRGFSRQLIENVIQVATDGLKPGLTLLFDLTVEECLTRTRRRPDGEHDRLDAEDADFHARVRTEYLRIAAAEPQRVKIIKAHGSVNETFAQVLDAVVPFLKRLNRLSAE